MQDNFTIAIHVPVFRGVTSFKIPAVSSMDLVDSDSNDSSGTASPTQLSTFTPQVKRERTHVPKMAFVSIQLEKVIF